MDGIEISTKGVYDNQFILKYRKTGVELFGTRMETCKDQKVANSCITWKQGESSGLGHRDMIESKCLTITKSCPKVRHVSTRQHIQLHYVSKT